MATENDEPSVEKQPLKPADWLMDTCPVHLTPKPCHVMCLAHLEHEPCPTCAWVAEKVADGWTEVLAGLRHQARKEGRQEPGQDQSADRGRGSLMMDAHERDVTNRALCAAIDGIGEVLSAGNVNWSEVERRTLRDAMDVLSTTRRGLRLVESA